MKKKALIFGITGQDGSYLAEFLLKKKYNVHGLVRRVALENKNHRYWRIQNIESNITLHSASLESYASIVKIIEKIKPNEIYHLGAQSYIDYAFKDEFSTLNTNINGTHYILSAIKDFSKKSKFYFAGSSEMFGKVQQIPQTEKTPFYPRSPYGVAKVYAHWITVNYREAYKIFACNGILFNHESPVRGETFVTKKIVGALCKIKFGLQKKLFLGNLEAKRDWGHAKDYVEAMWKMLQRKKADDYVISTGKQHSVKEFVNLVLKELNIKPTWKGKGVNSKCFDQKGNCIIECDKTYFRPLEVDTLLGDPRKAIRELKWKPTSHIEDLVKDMIKSELSLIKNAK